MKYRSFQILLILCFFVMLLFPASVSDGAKSGLLLWFLTVVPTLFPFLVISRMLLSSCACTLLNRLSGPVFQRLFHISAQGSFAVITGFLCGYPMGAKITADLLKENQISHSEASYLLSFCNHTSPAFMINYIILGHIRQESLILPSIFILYGTPVLLSFFFRIRKEDSTCENVSASDLSPEYSINACLTDSCEAILKIGGFIILFSVLINLMYKLPVSNMFFRAILLPSLELTSGISKLASMRLSFSVFYTLCMGHTAFGGWCAIFQTGSMIRGSGLSLRSYIAKKLVTAFVTSLFAYLYSVFL